MGKTICMDQLLQKAKIIIDNNALIQQEMNKRGEFYNIFSVLGLNTDEISHSAVLTNLLNPHGSHGMENQFLELFLKMLNIEQKALSSKKITVTKEKDIGPIKNDSNGNPSGGKIDIFIEFEKDFAIVIENKIMANDQNKQLLRYKNYVETQKFTDYRIIYLTLDGHAPEKQSSDGILSEKLIILSYQKDIKDWLGECIKQSACKSLIRETLLQYLNMIKELTGDTMNKNTENEIIKLLLQDNNIDIAAQMSNKLEAARKFFLSGEGDGNAGIVKLLNKVSYDNVKFFPEAQYIKFENKTQDSWTFGTFKKDDDYQLIFGFNKLTGNSSIITFSFYLRIKDDSKRNLDETKKEKLKYISPDFKSSWGDIIWSSKLKEHNQIDKIISNPQEQNDFVKDVEQKVKQIFDIIYGM